ncbi:hypothetical protein WICPIJ_003942 [Wickerhamomyces pijperi]|uniref:Guanine deaminase n=1 Tax=Wickerhamomyces pijperi TaxID=599730 RepID=A0A9P8Q8M0_WICPI|nr:hypothetical protein WICPIJ_003942 [Wickerhamomyces pijperi]
MTLNNDQQSIAQVFKGTFIHTPQFGQIEILTNTVIGLDHQGTIIFLQRGDLNIDHLQLPTTVKVIDLSADPLKFFFPGFIDTHIHASQYPNNGIFGNSTLLDWLETYTFPLESSLTNPKKAELVYSRCIKKLLSNGTTCASYYATIDAGSSNLLADLCLRLGQRAFIGKVCMDQNAPDYHVETLQQSQFATMEVLEHIKSLDSDLIKPVLTPRFAPACSGELMTWLGEVQKSEDVHLQTHLSENDKEIKWVKELFPDSETYTHVYHDHGLLNRKTILAHAIHLSDSEIQLIKDQQSGISHCPISNSSLTSGECRVKQLHAKGIDISLGTDCSGGFSPSILASARQALLVSRHLSMKSGDEADKLTVNEALYLGTVGGAKVLKMDDQLGLFKEGYRFDCQLIDLDVDNIDVFDWQFPSEVPISENVTKYDNLIAKWLFNGDDRNTIKVWVNGREVHSS